MYDSDGVIDGAVYEANVSYGAYASLLYDGGDGDDEIWMQYGWSSSSEDQGARLYGGNGNDILKNGYDNDDGLLMVG